MNVKEYISSGILEAYLLDEVTPQERMEVLRMTQLHPELKRELDRTETTLKSFAMKASVSPRKELKNMIMAKAEQALNGARSSKLIRLNPLPFWKYAAAASVVVALGTSYLAFNYRQQWKEANVALTDLIARNQRVAQNYNVVNQKLEKIQDDFSIIESSAFKKVVMKGTAGEPNALASVYWNATTEEVFLSIQNLKAISADNQFQLWAIVDGKPVDAGVFDTGFPGLLKMKSIKGATAFAVTIEPRGGRTAPTLATMQVVGTAG